MSISSLGGLLLGVIGVDRRVPPRKVQRPSWTSLIKNPHIKSQVLSTAGPGTMGGRVAASCTRGREDQCRGVLQESRVRHGGLAGNSPVNPRCIASEQSLADNALARAGESKNSTSSLGLLSAV